MGRVHRRTWTKLFVFFFLLFSAAGIASATTVIVPSDDDMIIGARAIIRGKVLSVGSALDAQQGRIFTYITVRVQEVYKGEVRARKIVLKQEGGQVGERGSVVFGTPQFTPGERVLLYLESWPDGSLRTHQLFLGKFTISADPQTGKKYVARSAPDENTTVLQSGGSGQTATVRVEYSTYIKMLREGIAANLERSRIFEETYYRNIPMLMQPPEYQERADKGAIEPQYTFIGNPPVRWFEPDAGQPVVFQVNLDQAPFPQTMEDINAAMAAWSNIAGCSLRIVNGGAAGVCFPSNETNTIIFNNCDNRWPITACSGTLAIGGLSWKSETKVVNGVIFRRATHGFISFNPYARCSYSSPCDLREIATHELGHTIGLGHSPFGDATMAAYAHFDGRCASLRDDDRNGAIFMYPSASGGGGPLAITTASPLPDGTVASPYAQTLAASGGTPPYSWSLVSGALPPGVGMDATGAISGTPTTTGTYNFTVQVTDAAQTPAQKSFSITINSSSYAAQFVSQNVPSRVTTGQQFSFNIKFNNTGSAAWSEADGVRIGSQNPPDNTTWGGNRVILPAGFVIAPGQQLDVAVQAIAPATPGTYNFQWQMVKEGGSFFGDLSPNLEITVTSPNTVVINGPTLIKAVQGVPVSQAYTAAGGAEPYTWSIASGALPPGMSLHAGNGTISGTPTATGNFTLTLQAADSASRTAQLPVTVTVSPPPLTIEEPARPEAVKGLSFTFRLNAKGGAPPYTWSISNGSLPDGVTLNAATGVLSGVPTATGTFTVTAQVADSQAQAAHKQVSITVVPPPLVILTAPSHLAIRGTPFEMPLSATGGTPPYTWSVTAGALPAGILLQTGSGMLAGMPSQSGLFTFTVTVSDGEAQNRAQVFQIQVVEPEAVPRIFSVKYKKGAGKLVVKGANFDPAAQLFIDGARVVARFRSAKAVSEGLVIPPGLHEVRVVNSNGISSLGVIISVN